MFGSADFSDTQFLAASCSLKMEHSDEYSSDSDSLLSLDSLLETSASSSSSASSVSSKSSCSSLTSDPESESSNSSASNTSFSSSEDEFFFNNEDVNDIRDELLEYIDQDGDEEGPQGSKYKFHMRRILDCSDSMSDKCFLALFRMTRPTFEKFYLEVYHLLPPGKQALYSYDFAF